MFIKREVIDAVGVFDKETFQKGYGEENDFCFRAEQLGYYQVLCDNTYIYHSGTVSFLSEEKKKLINEHEKILLQRYPKQVQKNLEYVNTNPHKYLRDNIEFYAKLKNGRKNILYVLQRDFRKDASDNIGGTQFHVKDLMQGLRNEYNIFVAARDRDYLRLTAYTDKDSVSFKFFIGNKKDYYQFFDSNIAEIFRNILAAFYIDLVHVHHVLDISFDIFYEAKQMNIPIFATLHDYYFICPEIKLLEMGKRYCVGRKAECSKCISSSLNYSNNIDYISCWRKKCKEALEICDLLIAPSQSAKDIYAEYYPELREKIKVIYHGADVSEEQLKSFGKEINGKIEFRIENCFRNGNNINGWAFVKGIDSLYCDISLIIQDKNGKIQSFKALKNARPDVAKVTQDNKYLNSGFFVFLPDNSFESGILKIQIVINNNNISYYSNIIEINGYINYEKNKKRIAFIGGLNEAKGSQLAYQIIKKADDKYDWYIFGGIGDAELFTLDKKNLRKTSWYDRNEIIKLLNDNLIDLVCILPIWPETFCYTLSEALISQIPVLATDIGALGERIKDGEYGWLVPYDVSADEVINKIEEILGDNIGYERVKKNLDSFVHKSIRSMINEYEILYNRSVSSNNKEFDYDRIKVYNAYAICANFTKSIGVNDDLNKRINELETTLNSIYSSIGYKMFNFMSKKRLPLKKQAKAMLLFGYKVYKKIGGN